MAEMRTSSVTAEAGQDVHRPAARGEQTHHRLDLTPEAVARRRHLVGLDDHDSPRITAVRQVVVDNADSLTTAFFDFLGEFEEAAPLFRNRQVLEQAKKLKYQHLIAMVGGEYGPAYAQQRIELAILYSRVGLPVRVFLGAFNHVVRQIGRAALEHAENQAAAADAFLSLQKVAAMDIALMVDLLIDEGERTIMSQQEAIRELSTPVIQLRDRLLILPIIGVLDSHRAMQVTESLLHAIRANRARVVVMDITGAAAVDSKVANHLIQSVAAARLMGAVVIITGISADVAQSLVSLGVELDRISTFGDLQGGIEEAERQLGYSVIPGPGPEAASARTPGSR